MKRKYSTEAGLNVFTSFTTIVPVEYLGQHIKKDTHKYHIYGILAYPKIYFKQNEVFIDEQGVHISFFCPTEGVDYTLEPMLIEGLDMSKANVVLKYPYDKMILEINDIDFLNKNQNFDAKQEMIAQEMFMYYSQFLMDYLRYEVLYVGQAYGQKGERTAFDRLSAHSTLQKILTDCQGKYSDKHIYIMLMELDVHLHLSFDGILSKNHIKSEEESERHYRDVISRPHKEQQIVNITEAAIINYFKPEYNVNFVENFPNNKHKGYSYYFDLDYNCLSVEINLEYENRPDLILYSKEKEMKSQFECIKYNLFNDENRANMYEIFTASTE